MLYDTRLHLPQLVEKMWIEDFRNGDITKLETDKILVSKMLSDKNFDNKLKIIDDEYKTRKEKLEKELNEIQEKLAEKSEEYNENEISHWETIIAELKRTIDNTAIPTPESNE